MIVGIDTMVLIYAGIVPRKGAATAALEELQVRSKLLLHHLRRDTIVLPTVAVSELLVPVAPIQRGPLVARLTTGFLCQPFDLVAGAIAAELWEFHRQLPKDQRYSDRSLLKADLMIVASAKAAGADKFYSCDRKCRAIAARVMESLDLPVNDPNDMFALDDIRRGEL